MKYTELSKEAKQVARQGLIDDSIAFEFDEGSGCFNHAQAHLDLLKNDLENDFDVDGVLGSKGGMYAG